MGKKPPTDPNQAAFNVIRQLTGETPKITPAERPKNPHAQALAALGASKGGKARAAKLTAKKRSKIAREAALRRWGAKSG